jgi:hypothetical protein
MNAIDEAAPELREIAREHEVRHEVWPEYAVVHGKRIQIGYEIELSGMADCEASDDLPGCKRCERAYADLRRIAEWAVERASARQADIEPFDSSWHSTPREGPRRRIVLKIRLTRHDGIGNPLDEEERHRLAALEDGLKTIGVGRGAERSGS